MGAGYSAGSHPTNKSGATKNHQDDCPYRCSRWVQGEIDYQRDRKANSCDRYETKPKSVPYVPHTRGASGVLPAGLPGRVPGADVLNRTRKQHKPRRLLPAGLWPSELVS
jgi:hypothetical protein